METEILAKVLLAALLPTGKNKKDWKKHPIQTLNIKKQSPF